MLGGSGLRVVEQTELPVLYGSELQAVELRYRYYPHGSDYLSRGTRFQGYEYQG